MHNHVETFLQDLRFTIRQLARYPGFTISAVVVLALGLGANTAIFSIVNAFLLRPLPFKDPARLTALFERDPIETPEGDPYNAVAAGNFLDWQRLSTSFDQMAATAGQAFNLASPTHTFEPQRIDGALCSSTFFSTLGVTPVLGRAFREDEDRWGAPRVAVIGYGLWQERFGGSRDVIGKQIRLDGENYEITGVMPRGFAFPYRTDQIWVPLLQSIPPELQKSHDMHFLLVIGRLRPNVSVEAARAEIDGLAKRYKRAHPEEVTGRGGNVVSLQTYLVRDARTSLLVLLGAVGCVLLIACVNVANLLLSRAAGRKREIAIREAVGASHGRIIRQLLTESILLALMGAGAGLFAAAFVSGALVMHAPGADAILPPGSLSADPVVFLFALAIALVSGVGAGLFPAVQSSRADVAGSLKDNTRSATATRSQTRFRNALVAAEVALSLILLICAGLLLRSFSRLFQVEPGVRIDHSLIAEISLPDPADNQHAKISASLSQLADRLKASPGVISAGMVSCPPVGGHCSDRVFSIEGHPLPPGQFNDALFRAADPGYFAAAGIPVLKGRTFTKRDGIGFDKNHPRPGAIVVSESMARQFFPHEDPIGKYISFGVDVEKANSTGIPVPRYQIIGIVGDVVANLDARIQPTVYVPLLDGQSSDVYIVLHTALEPHSIVPALRREVHRLNPDLPLVQVQTMEDMLGRSASDRRFSLLLFGCFAGLAALLAAVGLYGVLSYSVAQRRAEIGIRLALGASIGHVRTQVLKQGMTPAMIGVAAGVVGALFAVRAMKTLLFQVAATDALTFCLVPVLLLSISALACYVPALRATRIDPTEALRSE